MPLVRERMKTLTEAVDLLRFLFTDDMRPNEKAAELIAKAARGYLKQAADALDHGRSRGPRTDPGCARRGG